MIYIVIHRWGYWGTVRMDDEEGEKQPEWAASFALRFLDRVTSPCLITAHYVTKSLRWSDQPCLHVY